MIECHGGLPPDTVPAREHAGRLGFLPLVHEGEEANTRINPALGPRLLALPCTLVWATTWMSDANDCIAPWLGLPELPVVDWPDPANDAPVDGLHWKTRPLLDWAAGRPFAWIDDEITDRDRAWTEAHHPGRVLPHRIDPRYGLTDQDFAALGRWLQLHQG